MKRLFNKKFSNNYKTNNKNYQTQETFVNKNRKSLMEKYVQAITILIEKS